MRWCPRPSCGDFERYNSSFGRKITCKCLQEICLDCGKNYHGSPFCISCSNSRKCENSYLDLGFDPENVRLCPTCKAPIEKAEGCNHMVCYYCEYEFCWICGETYSKDHYSQLNPFGCSGSQFKKVPQANTCQKMFMLYLWRFILLIGVIVLGPFIMVLFVPVSLCYLCLEKSKELVADCSLRAIFLILMLPIVFALGLLADVVVIPVGLLFGAPYFALKQFYDKINTKRNSR